jgi:hypothetical protein
MSEKLMRTEVREKWRAGIGEMAKSGMQVVEITW